jgi:acyl carrier protein
LVIEKQALRALLTGGDKLHQAPTQKLPFAFINHYGPSESTVVTTRATVKENEQSQNTPPIGQPIDNTEVYLLDRHLQPVPAGITGELYIGGSGLARGYLGRAELTARRFVPHPFSTQPGARLYRSGDLAKLSPDGHLLFLGRCDEQVKLRGFRIELAEIAHTLRLHPAVAQALVLLRHDPPLGERLVAYLTLVETANCQPADLRQFLKERLPDYMLPAAYVTLSDWPLTANGKLDRRALPAPAQAEAGSAQSETASADAGRTPLERWLAQVWSEVLGVAAVSVQANFFESGGDSIKAAIIVNRVQQELGKIIHVVTIFDAPSIAQFAAYLEARYPEAAAQVVERLTGEAAETVSATCAGRLASSGGGGGAGRVAQAITVSDIAEMRRLVAAERERLRASGSRRSAGAPPRGRNRGAVFVLCPPRSGSTLLRVMLGGHVGMFAPPELELLGYEDLGQRRAALSGRHSFWRQGALRALMQVRGCELSQAEQEMAGYEEQQMSCQLFYALLQRAIGDRWLVDKSPTYTLDMETLRRGEEWFSEAHYLHLVRHPYAMIHSYEEAQLDQIFPRFRHPFGCREVGEMVWLISQQNILEFLAGVPARRQRRVSFERLVSEPEETLREVSGWLGLEYEEQMVEPYRERQQRMTDGVYREGKMLGDIKFHEHGGIEAGVSERWRERYTEGFLSAQSWEVAERLGYLRARDDIAPAHDKRANENGTRDVTPEQFTDLSPILPADGNGETQNMLARIDSLSDQEVEAALASLMCDNKSPQP